MDNLSHGENYSRLKDSYVIFLCLDSPFKKKRPVYFFETICRDDEEKEIAFEEGMARGAEQKAVENAENLLSEGLNPEMIARCIGLPLEKIREIAESISVSV